jgi:hypothetical protein
MQQPKRRKSEDRHELGIISDTHGLLRPEAMKALAGVTLIIHAGDIDTPEVLPAALAHDASPYRCQWPDSASAGLASNPN